MQATEVQRNLLRGLLDEFDIAEYAKQGIDIGVLYVAAAHLRPGAEKSDLIQEIDHLMRKRCDSVYPSTVNGHHNNRIIRTVDLRKKQVVDGRALLPGSMIDQHAPPERGAPDETCPVVAGPSAPSKYPEFADLEDSMDTFNGFPFRPGCTMNPHDTAQAEPFSTGQNGETKCFNCSWAHRLSEPGDVQLERHALRNTEYEHAKSQYEDPPPDSGIGGLERKASSPSLDNNVDDDFGDDMKSDA
ncbi:uncharacterized protein LOC135391782 [Ornithodoros turicata]|uniref:uncharacterized protein LOC135391782 n=1 Tax=Ornithodoros turicata TaxID=34597 RepID=UPI003139D17B